MSDYAGEPEFIEDGHIIRFMLDRDQVRITDVHCPNAGSTALCNRRRAYCVVQRFLDAYGIDLNLGRAHLNGAIEIAWCPIYGEDSDLDMEYATVWITPIEDPDYRLLMEERNVAAQIEGMGIDLPALDPPNAQELPPDDGEMIA